MEKCRTRMHLLNQCKPKIETELKKNTKFIKKSNFANAVITTTANSMWFT